MNWAKGLFRLWIVGSSLWVIFNFLVVGPENGGPRIWQLSLNSVAQKTAHPPHDIDLGLPQEDPFAQFADANPPSAWGSPDFWKVTLIPPVVILAIGSAFVWAFK